MLTIYLGIREAETQRIRESTIDIVDLAGSEDFNKSGHAAMLLAVKRKWKENASTKVCRHSNV